MSDTNMYPVADSATVEDIERTIRDARKSVDHYVDRIRVCADRYVKLTQRIAELEAMRQNLIEARDRDNAIIAAIDAMPLPTQHIREA